MKSIKIKEVESRLKMDELKRERTLKLFFVERYVWTPSGFRERKEKTG